MEIPPDNLWNLVLERLQLELSRPTFEAWIKTASAERLENNCLLIRTPNPFARNWLQKYYIQTIANLVQDIAGYPIEIYITVAKGDDDSQLNSQQNNNQVGGESFSSITSKNIRRNILENPPNTSD